MDGLELVCFQIITNVGSARSLFIEAIQECKGGNFDKAKELIAEGDNHFLEGHKFHTELIQQEASDSMSNINLLLIHAEDQMMSAEAFKIISTEFIELYEEVHSIKNMFANK